MNHTFHCHLSKSFQWYRNWHSHPRHGHAHWLIFASLSVLTVSYLSISTFLPSFNIPANNEIFAQVGFCGDGFCDGLPWEDENSCPSDCFPVGFFGDGFCDPSLGEDVTWWGD